MSERTAPGVSAPVVLLLVLTVLFQQIWSVLPQSYKSDEEKYAKRPYKFQFNIEDHHHRKEEKNDKGIIMGEFGFVTADFFYLTTVYATDEEGKFRILARSRKYIGPPTEKPPTRAVATTRRPATAPPSPQGSKPLVEPNKPLIPAKKPQGPFSGLTGCSSCVVPTTTRKPPVGVNINDERPFPGTGIKPVRGQGIGGVIPPARPGNFGTNYPTRPGAGKPATSFKPGAGKPATSFRPGAVGPTTSARPGQRVPVAPGSLKRPVSGINVSPGSRPGLGGLNQQVDRPVGSGGSGLVKGDKGGPNYRFNYTVGFHGHHETGYQGGSKEGGYFANHRDGEGQRVVYEANEFGYQPNVTKVRLSDAETPKEETEKEFGLKGYEFEWFN